MPERASKTEPSDPRSLPEATLVQMETKQRALVKYLTTKKTPIIDQRYRDGLFEHVSDTSWTGGDSEKERSEIYAIIGHQVGGMDRVVLPRSEYPELYVYKDEQVRLEKLMEVARRAEQEDSSKQSR
jgi:hypothetical protein